MLWGEAARGMGLEEQFNDSICPKNSTFFGQIKAVFRPEMLIWLVLAPYGPIH